MNMYQLGKGALWLWLCRPFSRVRGLSCTHLAFPGRGTGYGYVLVGGDGSPGDHGCVVALHYAHLSSGAQIFFIKVPTSLSTVTTLMGLTEQTALHAGGPFPREMVVRCSVASPGFDRAFLGMPPHAGRRPLPIIPLTQAGV
jgi:hypothetical protein